MRTMKDIPPGPRTGLAHACNEGPKWILKIVGIYEYHLSLRIHDRKKLKLSMLATG